MHAYPFQGGDERVDFSELALEIEPMSTERTTQAMQQRRMMEVFQLVANVAQLVPQMPYVRWQELLNKMGDALNIPDLGNLIDFDQVGGSQPSQMPGGQMPVQGGIAQIPAPGGGQGMGLPGAQSGGMQSGLLGAQ